MSRLFVLVFPLALVAALTYGLVRLLAAQGWNEA